MDETEQDLESPVYDNSERQEPEIIKKKSGKLRFYIIILASVVLILILLAIIIPLSIPEEENPFEGGGKGTPSDPYRIVVCEDLQLMQKYLSKHFALGKDINCKDLSFENNNTYNVTKDENFTGSLNGRGFSIHGLKIQENGSGGLFAYNKGLIQNIDFEDFDIRGKKVGVVCGANGGQIVDVTAKNGEIKYTSYGGGISGTNYHAGTHGSISRCKTDVQVTSDAYYSPGGGGIVGDNFEGKIIHCEVHGYITGIHVGGIAGQSTFMGDSSDGEIHHCSTKVTLKPKQTGGGICGISHVDIQNCSASVDITGPGTLGGISGHHIGNMSNCKTSGKITGIKDSHTPQQFYGG